MRDSSLSQGYLIIDLILGKQRQTITGTGGYGPRYAAFPPELQTRLTAYCCSGGNLLISGAYVASDLWDAPKTDSISQAFATKILKYKWMTGFGTQSGKVKPSQSPFRHLFDDSYTFYSQPNNQCYWIESPDVLQPASPDAYTVFHYDDNNKSAGVVYHGDDYKTVVLAFPIETIINTTQRNTLIKNIIHFFTNN